MIVENRCPVIVMFSETDTDKEYEVCWRFGLCLENYLWFIHILVHLS